jgi:hypothetical protein
VAVPVAGSYIFSSNSIIDTFGYIYSGNFSPSAPIQNLLGQDDDMGGSNQFRLLVDLQPDMSYILVSTTFVPNTTGNYTVVASGLQKVNLVLISNWITSTGTMSIAASK